MSVTGDFAFGQNRTPFSSTGAWQFGRSDQKDIALPPDVRRSFLRHGSILRFKSRESKGNIRGNTLQQSIAVYAIEAQLLQVNVSNMATARFLGARARVQCGLESAFVNVSDHVLHKMAPPHIAVAVNTEDRVARAASSSETFVVTVIQWKQGIESGKK
jgi:hypothetical protein